MNDGIQPLGPNTWRIQVGTGRDPVTGRYGRIRESFTGTKTEARRRRDELRTQVAGGTATQATKETVAAYLVRWIAHRQGLGKLRDQTARTYSGYVRREVAPRIGSLHVAQVRPVHIQRVIDGAIESGLAPRSVVQVYRIMHAAFKQAVRWQLVSVNPCDGATPPKVGAAKLTTPSPADVARVLDAIAPLYRVPLGVAAGTGLRRGEVLGLTWDAVDLDRRRVRVMGTLQRVEQELRVLEPKSERSRRTVPLSATLATALREVRTEQRERRLLSGPAWTEGGFVFDRGDGQPLDPGAFTQAFNKARKDAGLEAVRLHDVRHLFASMLVANGTNVRVVSDLLGHATVGFTLQTYVHGDEAAAIAAIDEAERLLGG